MVGFPWRDDTLLKFVNFKILVDHSIKEYILISPIRSNIFKIVFDVYDSRQAKLEFVYRYHLVFQREL